MNPYVVVSIHNEELYVSNLLKRLVKYKLPIVVIDDGSTDSSANAVRNLIKKGLKIHLLIHCVNLGKGAAMKTGADYSFAKGATHIIFMDGDGQHNPANIVQFTRLIKKHDCEVVMGSRNLNFGVPVIRFLGNKFASVFVAFLFGVYVSDAICGFRAMSKNAYKKLRWESAGYGVETEIVARMGKNKIKLCETPVDTIYHDSTKGVTILDAIGIFGQVIKWRLTL